MYKSFGLYMYFRNQVRFSRLVSYHNYNTLHIYVMFICLLISLRWEKSIWTSETLLTICEISTLPRGMDMLIFDVQIFQIFINIVLANNNQSEYLSIPTIYVPWSKNTLLEATVRSRSQFLTVSHLLDPWQIEIDLT